MLVAVDDLRQNGGNKSEYARNDEGSNEATGGLDVGLFEENEKVCGANEEIWRHAVLVIHVVTMAWIVVVGHGRIHPRLRTLKSGVGLMLTNEQEGEGQWKGIREIGV